MSDTAGSKSANLDPLRPIPDGGLAANLPTWLKDQPAWSTAKPPRPVIVPDDSVIDPRLLVSEEDFPDWLRGVAERVQVQVASDGTVLDPEFDLDISTGIAPRHRAPITHLDFGDTVTEIDAQAPVVRQWLDSGEVARARSRLENDSILLTLIGAAVLLMVLAAILLAM